ncbi:hypothetical protein [Anaerotignum neopropionicum]|nr:hypothetical protein [Anaerotignum neopropionicum]
MPEILSQVIFHIKKGAQAEISTCALFCVNTLFRFSHAMFVDFIAVNLCASSKRTVGVKVIPFTVEFMPFTEYHQAIFVVYRYCPASFCDQPCTGAEFMVSLINGTTLK